MPISHRHRLIFIHIPRTGGQSIERALGIDGCDNKGDLRQDLSILFGISPEGRALQHCTILELLRHRLVTESEFKSYFKFSFVRNPWDRLVSVYLRWQQRRHIGKKVGFEEFVYNLDYYTSAVEPANSVHLKSQSDFVTDENGGIIVDYIGRFEHLRRDFDKVCKLTNNHVSHLPHIGLTRGGHYSTYYNKKTRKEVAVRYAGDIELFGYDFM